MSYMRNMNYESNNIYTVVDNAFDLHLVIIIKAIYFKVKEDKYNNNIVFKFTFKLTKNFVVFVSIKESSSIATPLCGETLS